jgi:hypothetical protein
LELGCTIKNNQAGAIKLQDTNLIQNSKLE